jgi:hypothetical protein
MTFDTRILIQGLSLAFLLPLQIQHHRKMKSLITRLRVVASLMARPRTVIRSWYLCSVLWLSLGVTSCVPPFGGLNPEQQQYVNSCSESRAKKFVGLAPEEQIDMYLAIILRSHPPSNYDLRRLLAAQGEMIASAVAARIPSESGVSLYALLSVARETLRCTDSADARRKFASAAEERRRDGETNSDDLNSLDEFEGALASQPTTRMCQPLASVIAEVDQSDREICAR